MARARASLIIATATVFIMLIVMYAVFNYHNYLLLSLGIIGGIMMLFFIRFEIKTVKTREIVILALLAAIGAVARVPFAGLPSVQPTSFVIITVGLVFGAESGFLVGALAALVSNIFLGQGPWTPWQMFAWGTMGMSAGLLRQFAGMGNLWVLNTFGFIWGFIFGWMMNLWIVFSNMQNFTWEFLVGIYVSSFYHDLAHAISNIVFISLFSMSWTRILNRFKKKHGLLEDPALNQTINRT
ncbi:ECF transporter S component [Allobacillus halotolerans]|uniref:ECF transporter S component n=1 Tax=Allobacillus halotolerans TaxID=570278 RepID=A0ABS6GQX2_9BACI|nr:ECF transporter S component [Allobacillus halotolerans]MBU6081311.1 ECF transporter S component [Allobacillus halotolerans]